MLTLISVVSLLLNYNKSTGSEAAKILCFFPTVTRSQVMYAQPLLVALAEKGHQVTVVSQFPLAKPVKNYRDVVIPIDSGPFLCEYIIF